MQALQSFEAMCYSINVPIAHDKTEGPSQCLEFLGVTLDTIRLQAVLPQSKISSLFQQINHALLASKLTLKQMQCLLGHLNFATTVIKPGRAFSRRLIATTLGIRKQHHHIRLPAWAKQDLIMWRKFLEHANGCYFFRYFHLPSTLEFALVTDASGGIGCGGHWGTHWFRLRWPQWYLEQFNPSIAVLEMYPLYMACHLLSKNWCNHVVTFRSDNMAVVSILAKQSSPDPVIMAMVRDIVMLTMKFNFSYNIQHVSGVDNSIADKISRFQDFSRIYPHADKMPLELPSFLQLNDYTNILCSY